ncbi:MAG: MFS transporter [Bacteroidales bacterium]|nr:MFS transporter [Bacteroidales bacterium]
MKIAFFKRPFENIHRLRWWILGLLVIAMITSYIDRGNISMVAPLISDLLNLDPQKKGYIFSAFLLGYAIMQIPAGLLVDRFDIKWTYAIAYFIWGITASAFGFASVYWHFIVLRILLGIWESVSGPAGNAYVAKYFREDERGFASGLLVSGSKIGPAVGAIIAGCLIHHYGWQMLFILCGLVPLVWLIPWLLFYSEQDKIDRQKINASNKSPNNLKNIPLNLLIKKRKIWGIFLGYFFYGYVWFLYISWLPSYLYEVLGFSIKETGWWAGFAYGTLSIIVVISGWFADILIRRGYSPTKIRKTFIIAGFLFGTLILPVPFIQNPVSAVILVVITIGGMGLATANTWAITQSVAPENAIGTVAGIQNFGATFGGFLAPIISGFLIKSTGSYISVFVLAGIAMFFGIFCYVVFIGKVEQIKLNE